MIEGKITGCTFFQIKMREWQELEAGKTITLERDHNNPYDAHAVKAMFNGRQIGWIGKPENEQVAFNLDNNVDVTAEITRVFGDPMDRPHIELQFTW